MKYYVKLVFKNCPTYCLKNCSKNCPIKLNHNLSQNYPKNCPKKLSQQFRTLNWSLFNNFLVPQLYRTISLKISRQNFYESQNFPENFSENCPWDNICKIFMQNLSPEKNTIFKIYQEKSKIILCR